MTDKQIIIDGVDVSGCEYYNKINKHTGQYCICELEPNCLYKQVKRLENSEEKLVKQIQTICDFINNRPETFKGINGSVDKIITDYAERKEQECETLASQLDFEVQKKECLEQECEELKKENYELTEEVSIDRALFAEIDQLKADREEALKQLEFVRTLNTVKEAEIRKLTKTLTEIKEIAEDADRKLFATISDDYTEGYCWLGRIILQKISECEGNDELSWN